MIPSDREEPVVKEFLTIKDIVALVGEEPIGTVMENKWIKLQFSHCDFKLKTQA